MGPNKASVSQLVNMSPWAKPRHLLGWRWRSFSLDGKSFANEEFRTFFFLLLSIFCHSLEETSLIAVCAQNKNLSDLCYFVGRDFLDNLPLEPDTLQSHTTVQSGKRKEPLLTHKGCQQILFFPRENGSFWGSTLALNLSEVPHFLSSLLR